MPKAAWRQRSRYFLLAAVRRQAWAATHAETVGSPVAADHAAEHRCAANADDSGATYSEGVPVVECPILVPASEMAPSSPRQLPPAKSPTIMAGLCATAQFFFEHGLLVVMSIDGGGCSASDILCWVPLTRGPRNLRLRNRRWRWGLEVPVQCRSSHCPRSAVTCSDLLGPPPR